MSRMVTSRCVSAVTFRRRKCVPWGDDFVRQSLHLQTYLFLYNVQDQWMCALGITNLKVKDAYCLFVRIGESISPLVSQILSLQSSPPASIHIDEGLIKNSSLDDMKQDINFRMTDRSKSCSVANSQSHMSKVQNHDHANVNARWDDVSEMIDLTRRFHHSKVRSPPVVGHL